MRLVFLLVVLLGGVVSCDRTPQMPHDLLEARKAYSSRDYLSAELYYKQYLQKNSEALERWEAWERLVEIALVQGNDNEAIELLQNMGLEFSRDRDKKKKILKRLVSVYESKRRWSLVVQTLAELLAIPGLSLEEQSQYNLKLGQTYAIQHENDMAVTAFETCASAQATTETVAQCLLSLGSLYLDMDRLSDAQSVFARLEAVPGVPENYVVLSVFNMAVFMESKEKISEALTLFRSIMSRYPNPAVIAARVKSLEKQSGK